MSLARVPAKPRRRAAKAEAVEVAQPVDKPKKAKAAAKQAEVAVVFLGLPADEESEGYDRENLDLPGRQDDLVRAVAAAKALSGPKTTSAPT